MFDNENLVIDEITTVVEAEYPEAFVAGEYVRAISTFPHISVVQIDNQVYQQAMTMTNIENMARTVFEINVYSNKSTGKKSECKDIFTIINAVMERLGYMRTMLNPVPNIDDATIYRMVGRYEKLES